jgi:subtilisin
MTRALRYLALLVLTFSAFGIPLSAFAATAQSNVAQPYIVTLAPNVNNGAGIFAEALAHSAGFRVDQSYDAVIKGFAARLTPTQVQFLNATAQVTSIEPDLPTHITDQTIPTGVRRIGTTSNGTASIDGTDNPLNIDVATLDTGVDQTHPDLNVAGGYNCTSSNTGAWADDNGHGSHVAGTIAARDNSLGVVGVAPGARIWAVKVFDSTGSGAVSNIICGLNWVVQHSTTIKAVNFSGAWSGTSTPNCGANTNTNRFRPSNADTAHQAVCNMVNNYGIPFIVAAGNDGTNASNTLPAAYPEVISVGAVADSDGLPGGHGPATSWGNDDTRATFSNYGPAVTLFAPGVDILSTWLNGGYNTISGTSMATPHVTGAVLLYRLNHPTATPTQIKQALVANGEPGNWGGTTGTQPLLNVSNAAFGAAPTPTHNVAINSVTALDPAFVGIANTVRVQLTNNGSQSESGVSVTLKDGATTVGTLGPYTLGVGASQNADFSWTPSTSGSHTLQATVSFNTTGSNSLSATVTVATVTHDVEVTSIATLNPAYDGVANTVRVHIANQGNQAESNISVSLTDNTTAVGTSQTVTGPLAAGAGANVDFNWTPSGTGSHTLAATASNTNSTHSNSASINVSALVHDVQITSVSVPSQVTQGQSATVSVGVKNVGSYSETFSVSLTSSPANAAGDPAAQTITLTSGQSKTLTFSWATTSSTALQNYTLTAHASIDPESDNTPANNNLSGANQISVVAPTNTLPWWWRFR